MKIPLQKITAPLIASHGVNLHMLRLDLNHPTISGNKFFKLKYNLEEAKRQEKDTLLTFGGAFSNHIAATAAAGKEYGFKTVGIIRGEELQAPPQPSTLGREKNQTLKFVEECGMKLHFVSREEYRKKDSPEFIKTLVKQFGDFYLLPEGGTNELAVKGCAEILSLIDIPFDFVCCPVGTGGTLAGIISSLNPKQRAMGISVLKGGEFLKEEVTKLLNPPCPPLQGGDWSINFNYHFGGYGKHTTALMNFIADFEKQNNIPLEQVYTGKMIFGIYDLIRKNHFPKDSTVIAIHTGGLQGRLKPHPNPRHKGGD